VSTALRDGPAIPVLLYHAITTSPSEWVGPFAVAPQNFERHMDLVIACGRTPLTVRELARGLRGVASLPTRPVVITFDDGFADLIDTVAPILATRRLPATVFLTSGFVGGASPGGDRMVSWAGARELSSAGFDVGAHSVTHPQIDVLRGAEQRFEVTACRRELQDGLGLPISEFAYPHGYSNRRVRSLVRAAGYESACAVRNAMSHPRDRIDAIARLTVTADTSENAVMRWLDGRGAPLASPHDSWASYGWRAVRRVRYRT
jgi:peptidoglycan/xylan/chitin deacetylase (PgdA/CDA1 family)